MSFRGILKKNTDLNRSSTQESSSPRTPQEYYPTAAAAQESYSANLHYLNQFPNLQNTTNTTFSGIGSTAHQAYEYQPQQYQQHDRSSNINVELLAKALAEKSRLGLLGGPADASRPSDALRAIQSYDDVRISPPLSTVSSLPQINPATLTLEEEPFWQKFLTYAIEGGNPFHEERQMPINCSERRIDSTALPPEESNVSGRSTTVPPLLFDNIDEEDAFLYGESDMPPKVGPGKVVKETCQNLNSSVGEWSGSDVGCEIFKVSTSVSDLKCYEQDDCSQYAKRQNALTVPQIGTKNQISINLNLPQSISKECSEWEEPDDIVSNVKCGNTSNKNSTLKLSSSKVIEKIGQKDSNRTSKQDIASAELLKYSNTNKTINFLKDVKAKGSVSHSMDISTVSASFEKSKDATHLLQLKQQSSSRNELQLESSSKKSNYGSSQTLKWVPHQLRKKVTTSIKLNSGRTPKEELKNKTLKNEDIFASDETDDFSAIKTVEGERKSFDYMKKGTIVTKAKYSKLVSEAPNAKELVTDKKSKSEFQLFETRTVRLKSKGHDSSRDKLSDSRKISCDLSRRERSRSPNYYTKSKASHSPSHDLKKSYQNYEKEYYGSRYKTSRPKSYESSPSKYSHERSPRSYLHDNTKDDYYIRKKKRSSRSPKRHYYDQSPTGYWDDGSPCRDSYSRKSRAWSRSQSPSDGFERRSKRYLDDHSPDMRLYKKTPKMQPSEETYLSDNSRGSPITHMHDKNSKCRVSDCVTKKESTTRRSRRDLYEKFSHKEKVKDKSTSVQKYQISSAEKSTSREVIKVDESTLGNMHSPINSPEEKLDDNDNKYILSPKGVNPKQSEVALESPCPDEKQADSKNDEVSEFFRRLEENKKVANSAQMVDALCYSSAASNVCNIPTLSTSSVSIETGNTVLQSLPHNQPVPFSSEISPPLYGPPYPFCTPSLPSNQQQYSTALTYSSSAIPPQYSQNLPPYNPYIAPPQFYSPIPYYMPPPVSQSDIEPAVSMTEISSTVLTDMVTKGSFKTVKKAITRVRSLKEVPVVNSGSLSDNQIADIDVNGAEPVLPQQGEIDAPVSVEKKPITDCEVSPETTTSSPENTAGPPPISMFKTELETYKKLISRRSKINYDIEELTVKLGKFQKLQAEYKKKTGRNKESLKEVIEKTQEELDLNVAKAKKISSKLAKMKDKINSESLLAQETKKAEEAKSKLDFQVKYFFYDPGTHWCQLCNEVFTSLPHKLEHLQTSKHKQLMDPYERPWSAPVKEEPLLRKTSIIKKRQAVKGSEFIIPVEGFFCCMCKESFPDDLHAESHLKSFPHYEKYKKYIEENPEYERRYNEGMAAGVNVLESERKRKAAEDMKAAVVKRRKNRDGDSKSKVQGQEEDSDREEIEKLENLKQKSKGVTLHFSGMKHKVQEDKRTDVPATKTDPKVVYIGKAPNYWSRFASKTDKHSKKGEKEERTSKENTDNQFTGRTISYLKNKQKPSVSSNSEASIYAKKQKEQDSSSYGPKTLAETVKEVYTRSEAKNSENYAVQDGLKISGADKPKVNDSIKRQLKSDKENCHSVSAKEEPKASIEHSEVSEGKSLTQKPMNDASTKEAVSSKKCENSSDLASVQTLPNIPSLPDIKVNPIPEVAEQTNATSDSQIEKGPNTSIETAVDRAIKNILYGESPVVVPLSEIKLPEVPKQTKNVKKADDKNVNKVVENKSEKMVEKSKNLTDKVTGTSQNIVSVKVPPRLPKSANLTEEEEDFILLGINKEDMKPLAVPKRPPDSLISGHISNQSDVSNASRVNSSESAIESGPCNVLQYDSELSDSVMNATLSFDTLTAYAPPLPANTVIPSSTQDQIQSCAGMLNVDRPALGMMMNSSQELTMNISPICNNNIMRDSLPPFPPPLQVPPPNVIIHSQTPDIMQQSVMQSTPGINVGFPPSGVSGGTGMPTATPLNTFTPSSLQVLSSTTTHPSIGNAESYTIQIPLTTYAFDIASSILCDQVSQISSTGHHSITNPLELRGISNINSEVFSKAGNQSAVFSTSYQTLAQKQNRPQGSSFTPHSAAYCWRRSAVTVNSQPDQTSVFGNNSGVTNKEAVCESGSTSLKLDKKQDKQKPANHDTKMQAFEGKEKSVSQLENSFLSESAVLSANHKTKVVLDADIKPTQTAQNSGDMINSDSKVLTAAEIEKKVDNIVSSPKLSTETAVETKEKYLTEGEKKEPFVPRNKLDDHSSLSRIVTEAVDASAVTNAEAVQTKEDCVNTGNVDPSVATAVVTETEDMETNPKIDSEKPFATAEGCVIEKKEGDPFVSENTLEDHSALLTLDSEEVDVLSVMNIKTKQNFVSVDAIDSSVVNATSENMEAEITVLSPKAGNDAPMPHTQDHHVKEEFKDNRLPETAFEDYPCLPNVNTGALHVSPNTNVETMQSETNCVSTSNVDSLVATAVVTKTEDMEANSKIDTEGPIAMDEDRAIGEKVGDPFMLENPLEDHSPFLNLGSEEVDVLSVTNIKTKQNSANEDTIDSSVVNVMSEKKEAGITVMSPKLGNDVPMPCTQDHHVKEEFKDNSVPETAFEDYPCLPNVNTGTLHVSLNAKVETVQSEKNYESKDNANSSVVTSVVTEKEVKNVVIAQIGTEMSATAKEDCLVEEKNKSPLVTKTTLADNSSMTNISAGGVDASCIITYEGMQAERSAVSMDSVESSVITPIEDDVGVNITKIRSEIPVITKEYVLGEKDNPFVPENTLEDHSSVTNIATKGMDSSFIISNETMQEDSVSAGNVDSSVITGVVEDEVESMIARSKIVDEFVETKEGNLDEEEKSTFLLRNVSEDHVPSIGAEEVDTSSVIDVAAQVKSFVDTETVDSSVVTAMINKGENMEACPSLESERALEEKPNDLFVSESALKDDPTLPDIDNQRLNLLPVTKDKTGEKNSLSTENVDSCTVTAVVDEVESLMTSPKIKSEISLITEEGCVIEKKDKLFAPEDIIEDCSSLPNVYSKTMNVSSLPDFKSVQIEQSTENIDSSVVSNVGAEDNMAKRTVTSPKSDNNVPVAVKEDCSIEAKFSDPILPENALVDNPSLSIPNTDSKTVHMSSTAKLDTFHPEKMTVVTYNADSSAVTSGVTADEVKNTLTSPKSASEMLLKTNKDCLVEVMVNAPSVPESPFVDHSPSPNIGNEAMDVSSSESFEPLQKEQNLVSSCGVNSSVVSAGTTADLTIENVVSSSEMPAVINKDFLVGEEKNSFVSSNISIDSSLSFGIDRIYVSSVNSEQTLQKVDSVNDFDYPSLDIALPVEEKNEDTSCPDAHKEATVKIAEECVLLAKEEEILYPKSVTAVSSAGNIIPPVSVAEMSSTISPIPIQRTDVTIAAAPTIACETKAADASALNFAVKHSSDIESTFITPSVPHQELSVKLSSETEDKANTEIIFTEDQLPILETSHHKDEVKLKGNASVNCNNTLTKTNEDSVIEKMEAPMMRSIQPCAINSVVEEEVRKEIKESMNNISPKELSSGDIKCSSSEMSFHAGKDGEYLSCHDNNLITSDVKSTSCFSETKESIVRQEESEERSLTEGNCENLPSSIDIAVDSKEGADENHSEKSETDSAFVVDDKKLSDSQEKTLNISCVKEESEVKSEGENKLTLDEENTFAEVATKSPSKRNIRQSKKSSTRRIMTRSMIKSRLEKKQKSAPGDDVVNEDGKMDSDTDEYDCND